MTLDTFLSHAVADCTGVQSVAACVREVMEYREQHSMHRLPPRPLVTAWLVATATDMSDESRVLLEAGLAEAMRGAE